MFAAANKVLDAFSKFTFASYRDIRKAMRVPTLKNMEVLKDITSKLGPYSKAVKDSEDTIDFEYAKGIQELGKIADILGIAYDGCRGFECQPKVIELQSGYQTLMHNSKTTSETFVKTSLNALQYINTVGAYYRNDKFAQGNKFLALTRGFVTDMRDITNDIIKKIENIIEISSETILVANNDNSMLGAQSLKDKEDRKQWQKEKDVLAGKVKGYEAVIKTQEAEIAKSIADQKKELARTKTEKTPHTVKGSCTNYFFYKHCDGDSVHYTTNVISTTNNAVLAKFITAEHTLLVAKAKLVSSKIRDSALVVKKAEQIKNAIANADKTAAALNGLDLAINNLHLAHVFFNRMKAYWEDMIQELRDLGAIQNDTKDIIQQINDDNEGNKVSIINPKPLFTFILVELYQGVGEEGLRWLRVGYKSIQGYLLFQQRVKEIDNLSSNIPVTDAEGKKLTEKLINDLKLKLKVDKVGLVKEYENAKKRFTASKNLVKGTLNEQKKKNG